MITWDLVSGWWLNQEVPEGIFSLESILILLSESLYYMSSLSENQTCNVRNFWLDGNYIFKDSFSMKGDDKKKCRISLDSCYTWEVRTDYMVLHFQYQIQKLETKRIPCYIHRNHTNFNVPEWDIGIAFTLSILQNYTSNDGFYHSDIPMFQEEQKNIVKI